MKTAISLPDELFRDAERYAQQTGKSRSQLFGEALRQYLLQHTPDTVTEAMNRVCDQLDQVDQEEASFTRKAGGKLLRKESW